MPRRSGRRVRSTPQSAGPMSWIPLAVSGALTAVDVGTAVYRWIKKDDEPRGGKQDEEEIAKTKAEAAAEIARVKAEAAAQIKIAEMKAEAAAEIARVRADAAAEIEIAKVKAETAEETANRRAGMAEGLERQRADLAESGRPRDLPEVCRDHNTPAGCTTPSCRRLHVCHLFLAGICKYGDGCNKGHDMDSPHNQEVCAQCLPAAAPADRQQLLQTLRGAFQRDGDMPDAEYQRHLSRCHAASGDTPCTPFCNRLHVCRELIKGGCKQKSCQFSHSLRTEHNKTVLERHRATSLSDEQIISLLLQKEH